MLKRVRTWLRRRWYREGRNLSRFIACDVRREILIVSAAKVEEGIITGRVRTTNLLYVSGGMVAEPEFRPPQELLSKEMWHWTGQSWGGLPDGTSLAARLIAESADAAYERAAHGVGGGRGATCNSLSPAGPTDRNEKMLASHRAAPLHSTHTGTQASCSPIVSP
ncbi:MAG: hypothetical protein FJ271_22770 [Planctomycetes bacterium]|nr:hypothetical protein [Planctomycetota bacterium]